MILNIHGLDGGRTNTNYRELLKIFDEDRVESPQLDYRSERIGDILGELKKIVEGKRLIVGKSLGGFFAAYLSAEYEVPCVLVNPCLRPDLYLDKLMDGYLDENRGEIGKMMGEIANSDFLKKYAHMIFGKDDDLLNPADAMGVLPDCDTVLLPGGHDISGSAFSRTFEEMVKKETYNYEK